MNRREFILYSAAMLAIGNSHAKARELECEIAVIGGGVGGYAAALAALRNGRRVILTEETRWIGGQLTAQAVPPDEHPWIEQFGCTRSYRAYRESVREYYRRNYSLTSQARARTDLNPGNSSVSRLTHEFRVSVAVLEAALAPYVSSGQLLVLLEHVPQSAETDRDRVRSLAVRDTRSGLIRAIRAKYFLDATELGDLVALTKTECVTGAESQADTGELHAPAKSQPANSQSFTYCFAMDYLVGEDHTIERPRDYDFWRGYVPNLAPPWPGSLLSWTYCEPTSLRPIKADFTPNPQPSGHWARLYCATILSRIVFAVSAAMFVLPQCFVHIGKIPVISVPDPLALPQFGHIAVCPEIGWIFTEDCLVFSFDFWLYCIDRGGITGNDRVCSVFSNPSVVEH